MLAAGEAAGRKHLSADKMERCNWFMVVLRQSYFLQKSLSIFDQNNMKKETMKEVEGGIQTSPLPPHYYSTAQLCTQL